MSLISKVAEMEAYLGLSHPMELECGMGRGKSYNGIENVDLLQSEGGINSSLARCNKCDYKMHFSHRV